MNGNISLGSNNDNKITNSASPTDANDLANKNYVDTMMPVFKTTTGTLGSSSQYNYILQCTAMKNPQNNKIYLGKMWVERGVGEWFSIEICLVLITLLACLVVASSSFIKLVLCELLHSLGLSLLVGHATIDLTISNSHSYVTSLTLLYRTWKLTSENTLTIG